MTLNKKWIDWVFPDTCLRFNRIIDSIVQMSTNFFFSVMAIIKTNGKNI